MNISIPLLIAILAIFLLDPSAAQSNSTNDIFAEINEGGNHDTALDEYFLGVLEGFRLVMPIGFPDFGIPKLDPFFMEEQVVDFKNDNTQLYLRLHNLTLQGVSSFEVPLLRVSLPNFRWQLGLRIPEVFANGSYYLNGTGLYVLPLKGYGQWHVRIVNLTIGIVLQLGQKNEKTQIQVSKLIGDLGLFDSHFDNLFGEGNLSLVINSIVRRHSRTFMGRVLQQIRGLLDTNLGRITDLVDASIFTEFGEKKT